MEGEIGEYRLHYGNSIHIYIVLSLRFNVLVVLFIAQYM